MEKVSVRIFDQVLAQTELSQRGHGDVETIEREIIHLALLRPYRSNQLVERANLARRAMTPLDQTCEQLAQDRTPSQVDAFTAFGREPRADLFHVENVDR